MNALTRRGICVSLLAFPLLVTASVSGAPEKSSQPYVLFMGADIAIEHGKKFYRVDDVAGSNFIIHVAGKEEFIPTQKGTARMRVDNALKIAASPVSLDKLETERDYTPAHDPRRAFNRNSGMAGSAAATSDVAAIDYRLGQTAVAYASIDPHAPAAAIEAAHAFQDSSTAAVNSAFAAEGSEINSTGYHAQQLQVELAKENFDAIRISLQVSSQRTLEDPYVLVIARIHERDEKPGVFRNWIFAQKIDPVDAKPQKINISQGGFPAGYTLDDVQVRIFDHGREMPSNLSPKRVDLTHKQAQQYVVIEHLAAHKEDTMPAMPVFGEAPADLKARLGSGEFSQPFYVTVDAGGNATGTFTDKDCKNAAGDPYVQQIVANSLFTPALEKGKPVAGVASMRLGSLIN